MDPLQEFIKERMAARGIKNLAELARRARRPGSSIHNLVTQPRVGMPRTDTLEALAGPLGTTLEELEAKAWEARGKARTDHGETPQVRRGDHMVPIVGDLEGMSDLDLLRLQEAINTEQRRRHERSGR